MKDLITRDTITIASGTFLAELVARQAFSAPTQSNTMASVLALALIRDGSLPISALEEYYITEGMPTRQIKLLISVIEDMVKKIEEIQHDIPTV